MLAIFRLHSGACYAWNASYWSPFPFIISSEAVSFCIGDVSYSLSFLQPVGSPGHGNMQIISQNVPPSVLHSRPVYSKQERSQALAVGWSRLRLTESSLHQAQFSQRCTNDTGLQPASVFLGGGIF